MAAITPTLVRSNTLGSKRLILARFTTSADGDTWASGIDTGIFAYWTQDRSNPATQASVGMAATESSGTFTFYPAEDSKAFDLFILLGS